MKISTRGRYALRIMLELAKENADSYISLKDLSEKQSISKKYLEQIIPSLNKSGLLVTTRGNQGGYRLSKSPKDITVYDIIVSAEGCLSPVECIKDDGIDCERKDCCLTLPVWKGLYDVISNYLKKITLQDVLDNKANDLNM